MGNALPPQRLELLGNLARFRSKYDPNGPTLVGLIIRADQGAQPDGSPWPLVLWGGESDPLGKHGAPFLEYECLDLRIEEG